MVDYLRLGARRVIKPAQRPDSILGQQKLEIPEQPKGNSSGPQETSNKIKIVSLLIMVRGQSVPMSNIYSLSEDILSLLL